MVSENEDSGYSSSRTARQDSNSGPAASPGSLQDAYGNPIAIQKSLETGLAIQKNKQKKERESRRLQKVNERITRLEQNFDDMKQTVIKFMASMEEAGYSPKPAAKAAAAEMRHVTHRLSTLQSQLRLLRDDVKQQITKQISQETQKQYDELMKRLQTILASNNISQQDQVRNLVESLGEGKLSVKNCTELKLQIDSLARNSVSVASHNALTSLVDVMAETSVSSDKYVALENLVTCISANCTSLGFVEQQIKEETKELKGLCEKVSEIEKKNAELQAFVDDLAKADPALRNAFEAQLSLVKAMQDEYETQKNMLNDKINSLDSKLNKTIADTISAVLTREENCQQRTPISTAISYDERDKGHPRVTPNDAVQELDDLPVVHKPKQVKRIRRRRPSNHSDDGGSAPLPLPSLPPIPFENPKKAIIRCESIEATKPQLHLQQRQFEVPHLEHRYVDLVQVRYDKVLLGSRCTLDEQPTNEEGITMLSEADVSRKLYVYNATNWEHRITISAPKPLWDIAWAQGKIVCITNSGGQRQLLVMDEYGKTISTAENFHYPVSVFVNVTSQVFYVADEERGVFQSTNDGASWHRVFRRQEGVRCQQVIKIADKINSDCGNSKFWVLETKGDLHRLRIYLIGASEDGHSTGSIVATHTVSLPEGEKVNLKRCKMAYDHDDTVYLTDRQSGVIHAFSTTSDSGRYLGSVLTCDSLKPPHSLATDSTGSTLYVGQEGAVTVCSVVAGN